MFINLITDGLPAFALGLEQAEKDIMEKPPRKNASSIFTKSVAKELLFEALIQSILIIGLYIFGTKHFSDKVSTMCFFTFSLMELNHSVNMKTNKSIFTINLFNNKYFNISYLTGILVNVFVYILPITRTIFNISILTLKEWLIVFSISLSIIPIVEIYKLLQNKKSSEKLI